MDKKTKQSFVWLGRLSILAWLVTTFSLIAFFLIKGSPPIPPTPTVPQRVYVNVVASFNTWILVVVPVLTSGYLIIGLFILKYIQRSKQDQD